MKKNIIILIVLILVLSSLVFLFIKTKINNSAINGFMQASKSGSALSSVKTKPNTTDGITFSLNGVSLGMKKGTVIRILGNHYTERYKYEEMLSCTLNVLEYKNEFVVSLWDSAVIEIVALSPTIKTNLGCKIGDTFSFIKKKHTLLYKPYVSDYLNPPQVIPGWYIYETTILIFDFDKNDGAICNTKVADDQKVEQIVLLYESNLN